MSPLKGEMSAAADRGVICERFTVEKRFQLETPPPPNGGPPRTERSPLSLRDISPPRGESPLEGRQVKKAPLKGELASRRLD